MVAGHYFRLAFGAIMVSMVMHGLLQAATWLLGGVAAVYLFRKVRDDEVTPAGIVQLPHAHHSADMTTRTSPDRTLP